MTPHDHTTIVPGCYRCELGQDEARDALIDEIAQELYAAGPWGEFHDLVDNGARAITDAHDMDVYRKMADLALKIAKPEGAQS